MVEAKFLLPISELWNSTDPHAWRAALDHYWDLVKPGNRALEEDLDRPGLAARMQRMEAAEWYAFLRDEYFRWKYTAPNRYGSTTKLLRVFVEARGVDALDKYRRHILDLDHENIAGALAAADAIPGLGIAGASGLLALMYPREFGTVDQFVVKALRLVPGLPETEKLKRMNPEGVGARDGELLIDIMRRKAAELTHALSTPWTPRMIDKVLWAAGR